jgi:hypothetical protein
MQQQAEDGSMETTSDLIKKNEEKIVREEVKKALLRRQAAIDALKEIVAPDAMADRVKEYQDANGQVILELFYEACWCRYFPERSICPEGGIARKDVRLSDIVNDARLFSDDDRLALFEKIRHGKYYR